MIFFSAVLECAAALTSKMRERDKAKMTASTRPIHSRQRAGAGRSSSSRSRSPEDLRPRAIALEPVEPERRASGQFADRAEGAVVFAAARGAARACDLSAELGRRAQRLQDAAAKLRAKGAPAALAALLDDDSLSASSRIGGPMSERGARRLFDRLVLLGAVRELTGRATFRLYGL